MVIVRETGVAPAPVAIELGLKTQAAVESGNPVQASVTAVAKADDPVGVVVKGLMGWIAGCPVGDSPTVTRPETEQFCGDPSHCCRRQAAAPNRA